MTEPEVSAKAKAAMRLDRTGWAVLAFAALIAGGLFVTGWKDAISALNTVGGIGIIVLSALALGHYLLRAARWHILVRRGGVTLNWRITTLQFFGGFAMTATPGRVGELVRLRWLMRTTGRGFGHLLPIAFADRAIELAAMVGLITLALLATNLGTLVVWWVLAAGLVLVWVVCRPAILLRVINALFVIVGRRKPRLFVKLRRMVRRLGPFMAPDIFVPTLLIGLLGWAVEGLAFWLLLTWLGAEITLPAATAIFLVAVLSGALSGLPGGLGGTEATAVTLLVLQGVSLETALIATAVIRIATLWFAVALGFGLLPFAEAQANEMEAERQ